MCVDDAGGLRGGFGTGKKECEGNRASSDDDARVTGIEGEIKEEIIKKKKTCIKEYINEKNSEVKYK